ncbi:hypothetical protein ACTXT7_001826 [Hymenolepis weldensis]
MSDSTYPFETISHYSKKHPKMLHNTGFEFYQKQCTNHLFNVWTFHGNAKCKSDNKSEKEDLAYGVFN